MASSVIHMAVANEINKKLNRDSSKLLIGSIAPDIAKLVGENKVTSHFLSSINTDVPNIEKFLNKYKKHLNDDFVMGYYIHLYTDYLWFKYFITEILNDGKVIKIDGTEVKLSGNMLGLYIYNDYSSINVQILEEYDLDLKIFSNDIPKFNNIITEIPMDKINLIVESVGILISNSKKRKRLIFDIDNICKFIETSTELILATINSN